MDHTGRGQSDVAGGEAPCLVPDRHVTGALEDDVQLVPVAVSVGFVLLPGLEGIQPAEKVIPGSQVGLTHLCRPEDRPSGCAFDSSSPPLTLDDPTNEFVVVSSTLRNAVAQRDRQRLPQQQNKKREKVATAAFVDGGRFFDSVRKKCQLKTKKTRRTSPSSSELLTR